jgi:hypothetical protein
MKAIARENTWISRGFMDFGWGNGYVLIPKNNKLHGKDYNNIDVDIHGGLTFSELVDEEMVKDWDFDSEDLGKWCVGFDTAHGGDTLSFWTKERVEEETERLKYQLQTISK